MDAYYPKIEAALGMFVFLGVELTVLFILISAGVSLLQQYVSDEKIQAILSGSKGRGYILAALLGAVTPFCSCSTIPMLRGLLKAKVGFGSTLTFLFASPLLNPIIIGLFIATFGLNVTITYSTLALAVSILGGVVLHHMGFERYIIPEGDAQHVSCCASDAKQAQTTSCCANEQAPLKVAPAPSACCAEAKQPASACCDAEPKSTCCDSASKGQTPLIPVAPSSAPLSRLAACCGSDQGKQQDMKAAQQSFGGSCCGAMPMPACAGFMQKVAKAFQDALKQFKQVLPYLLLGISFGAVIYGFVPSDFIAEHASGDSLFAVPLAAVIGIPLYIRVEALIPLSAVLVGKGMGLGAVMALIIGGGGASITEVILLKSMFRTPMVVAFLVVILGMAVITGYLFQFMG